MQFAKITVPGGEVAEAPSAPPANIGGWVRQAEAGVPEALAALANPAAAVNPCPANLEGVGWVPWTPPVEGEE